MGLHADDGAVEPADSQHAADRADGVVIVFQHPALFDLGFEVRINLMPTGLSVADLASALQLSFH